MKLLKLIGGILIGTLFCSCYAPKSNIVHIEYQGKQDYTPIIYEALLAHKGGNVVLQFDNAVYDIYPERAEALYMAVSNNDNSVKRVAFHINTMENVEIVGEQTEFRFHGAIVPFYIVDSKQISISGISIDYDTSFIFEGQVVANNQAENYIDLKPREDIRYSVQGESLTYYGYDWSAKLGENITFDATTSSPYYFTSKYLHHSWKFPLKAKELGEGLVRLYNFNSPQVPPVGSIYIDKGEVNHNRLYPAISIQSSSDIFITNSNVYMSGAMALICETTENITLDGLDVKLREGSDRFISASADATHFVNCRGLISFNDCHFENMLDDATNVHGTYMKIDKVTSKNSFTSTFGHIQQQGFNFAKSGDKLQIIDADNLLPLKSVTVSSAKQINENYWSIQTVESIAEFMDNNRLSVGNMTNQAQVVMRNCTVRNNRARSILISTPKPVLIENNYFSSMMAGVLIAGDANKWCESGYVSDVTIRGNTFVDLGKGGEAPQSVLQISPEIAPEHRGDGFYHGKIVFEDNIINTFDCQVIYALSVDELVIRDNKFIETYDYEPIYSGLSYIDLQHCNNLTITGNSFKGDNQVCVSENSCQSVDYQVDQDGFAEQTTHNANSFFYQQ